MKPGAPSLYSTRLLVQLRSACIIGAIAPIPSPHASNEEEHDFGACIPTLTALIEAGKI